LGLATVTLVVAVTSQDSATRAQPLTELWLTDLNSDSQLTVNLRNSEGSERESRVSIQVSDLPTDVQDVTVADGSIWSTPVQVQRSGSDLEDLVVEVFVGDDNAVYRQVALNGGTPALP
jgi:hypothetical protein